MIIGMGTDLVEIPRIEMALQRFGKRFSQRILSEYEYSRFVEHRYPAAFLAKRFAAKEAAVKALGIGFRHGIQWQHIEVRNTALGQPTLRYFAQALTYCQQRNVQQVHLSLSDTRVLAIATVILES